VSGTPAAENKVRRWVGIFSGFRVRLDFSCRTSWLRWQTDIRVSQSVDYTVTSQVRGLPASRCVSVSQQHMASLMAWCLVILLGLSYTAMQPVSVNRGTTTAGVGNADAVAEAQSDCHSNCVVWESSDRSLTRSALEASPRCDVRRQRGTELCSGNQLIVPLYLSSSWQNAGLIPKRLLLPYYCYYFNPCYIWSRGV